MTEQLTTSAELWPEIHDAAGISDGAASLADGDFGKFMNAVSLRVAPPRSSKSAAPKVEPAPAKKAPDPEDTTPEKTPLQKLMEKFR